MKLKPIITLHIHHSVAQQFLADLEDPASQAVCHEVATEGMILRLPTVFSYQ